MVSEDRLLFLGTVGNTETSLFTYQIGTSNLVKSGAKSSIIDALLYFKIVRLFTLISRNFKSSMNKISNYARQIF